MMRNVILQVKLKIMSGFASSNIQSENIFTSPHVFALNTQCSSNSSRFCRNLGHTCFRISLLPIGSLTPRRTQWTRAFVEFTRATSQDAAARWFSHPTWPSTTGNPPHTRTPELSHGGLQFPSHHWAFQRGCQAVYVASTHGYGFPSYIVPCPKTSHWAHDQRFNTW